MPITLTRPHGLQYASLEHSGGGADTDAMPHVRRRTAPFVPATAARSRMATVSVRPRHELLAVAVVTFVVVCGLIMLGRVAAAPVEEPAQTSPVPARVGETVWDVGQGR